MIGRTFRCLTLGGWLNLAGLIIGLAGSYVATNAFMTKERALRVGVPVWAGDTPEENLKAPLVQELLAQGRDGRVGLGLVALAFVLQVVAVFVDAYRAARKQTPTADGERGGVTSGGRTA
jgi:hypothetical protein